MLQPLLRNVWFRCLEACPFVGTVTKWFFPGLAASANPKVLPRHCRYNFACRINQLNFFGIHLIRAIWCEFYGCFSHSEIMAKYKHNVKRKLQPSSLRSGFAEEANFLGFRLPRSLSLSRNDMRKLNPLAKLIYKLMSSEAR